MIIMLTIVASPSWAQNPTSIVEADAVPVKCADGFKFSEGPVCDADGNVWFSDYGTNTIYRWMTDGTLEKVRENLGGPIGLYFNDSGILYACMAKGHRITAFGPGDKITEFPDRFAGRLYNSPNDIWIDSKGGVYFTDPRFSPLPEDVEQDGFHVYYIPPGDKPIIRAATDLTKPNGIAGSPDGRTVYVTDTPENKTFAYTVRDNGLLTDKRLFAPEGYDGMTVDTGGNVYITMEHSVEVYTSAGVKIESIPVPDKPTNVCFGGTDKKTLFITARSSLYSLRMRVNGL